MLSLSQHEKFTSQLQLSQKRPEAEASRAPEVQAPAEAACEGAAAKPPEAFKGEDKLTGEGAGLCRDHGGGTDGRPCHTAPCVVSVVCRL